MPTQRLSTSQRAEIVLVLRRFAPRVAMVALVAAGLHLAAAPAAAQTAPAPEPAASAAPAPAAEAPATTSVDDILAGEEDVLSGTTYSYDPGSRRDPFRSLLVAKSKAERKGALPEGIPGLLIEEIDLTGIFRTSRGFVAQVLASNKEKSYLIREGDQLYDGDVVSITQQEVVFKQIVSDPTVIKPFREVIKKLSP